ncbi:MAG: Lrp/AsnC ligand binding domain-containing protein, partial [Kribbellaceae bacterium]
ATHHARVTRVAVQAYVFVSTTNPGPRAACLAIRRLNGVVRADALFGGPPVVAIVEGDDLGALDSIIDHIVDLPMVTDTETHVVRDLQPS